MSGSSKYSIFANFIICLIFFILSLVKHLNSPSNRLGTLISTPKVNSNSLSNFSVTEHFCNLPLEWV